MIASTPMPEPGDTAVQSPAAFPVAAIRHLAIVVGILFAASLLPYASGALADYRYWDRMDTSGLLRAVTFTAPPRLDDAVADGVPNTDGPELAGADLDQLAGMAKAAPVGPQAEMPSAQLALPGDVTAPQASPTPAALDVADEALGGQKTWLDGEAHALDPFWQALADLAADKRSHVRIAHYGDSHIANDGITHVSRQLLQRRFGDGGHGFVLVQGRTQWYQHKGVQRSASGGWRLVNFLNGNARDGAYGYAGVAAEAGAGEWFGLDTAKGHTASRFVLYLRSLGKATIAVRIDGKPAKELKITSASGTDSAETWPVADGSHAIQWRVTAGRVRVFGGALEREKGIVYDSLGEVGARGTRWLNADAKHMAAVMAQRPPDLLIVNYGGNERTDKISETNYLEKMGKVVERLRGGQTHGACLVLGPGDHGTRERGKVISDPDIIRINRWQRTLAAQTGCAFYDTRALMGGEGAMGRWVKSGLGWSDYSHFTGKGEQAMGVALYRAMLKGLRDWQGRVRTAAR